MYVEITSVHGGMENGHDLAPKLNVGKAERLVH